MEFWFIGLAGPTCFINGKFGLVEVKASGKKPRVLQEHRHDQLRSLGYKVFVLDDAGQIGGILDGIQTT